MKIAKTHCLLSALQVVAKLKNMNYLLTRASILVILCCSLICNVAVGENAFSAEQEAVTTYLHSIVNLTAKFTQFTLINGQKDNESLATGSIILKKPNRLLISLKSKNDNYKISVSGKKIKFLDNKIKQLSHIDNQYNNLFQLFDKSYLDKSIIIRKISNNRLSVAMSDFDRNSLSVSLTVKIIDNKYYIDTIQTIQYDENQSTITNIMQLEDLVINGTVQDSAFQIEDPRLFDSNEYN